MFRGSISFLVVTGAVAAVVAARCARDAAGRRDAEVLRGRVDRLCAVVSEIRGLGWKQPVALEVVGRDQWRESLRPPGSATAANAAQDDVAAHIEETARAYYDTRRRTLVIVEDGSGSPASDSTVVHELTHAVEDQHFDLRALRLAMAADDPTGFSYRCLAEGSAEHVRTTFEERSHLAVRTPIVPSAAGTPEKAMLRAAYAVGLAFVRARCGAEGPRGADRLFADPPRSQSEVLHPGELRRPATLELGAAGRSEQADRTGVLGGTADPVRAGEASFAIWLERTADDARSTASDPASGGRPWSHWTDVAADGYVGGWSWGCAAAAGAPAEAWLCRWRSAADASEAAQVFLRLAATQGPAVRLEERADGTRRAVAGAGGRAAAVGVRGRDVAFARVGDPVRAAALIDALMEIGIRDASR